MDNNDTQVHITSKVHDYSKWRNHRRHSSFIGKALTKDVKGHQKFKRSSSFICIKNHSSSKKEQLKSTNEIEVADNEQANEREKEKNELKSRIEELEEFKVKYEQEKRNNEQLQQKVDQSLLSQSDTSKALFRSNELVERLRSDNKKKTEQIEKYQSTISHMEDRMRNLEIRASEVEKAELILETTKQNLESTQTQVRARDSEIRRLTKEYEDKTKQLEYANEKISSLEVKIEDLKFQVRHELMKNENIEKNLETIPRLKDEIADRDKALCVAQKEIEEKVALLTAARKAVREYKDQTRDYEKTSSDVDHLQNELDITKCEVNTLKKLMLGKDHLVSQKSKALDLAKEVIQTMQSSADKEQTEKIVRWIDRIGTTATENDTVTQQDFNGPKNGYNRPKSPHNKMKPYTTVHHMKEIDVSHPPYSSDPDCIHHNGKSDRPMSGNTFPARNHSDDSRPKTAVVRPTINKSSSFKEQSPSRGHSSISRWHSQKMPNSSKKCENSPKYNSDTKSSKFSPSLDYVIGAKNSDICNVVDLEDGRNSSQCQLVKRTHSDNSISDSISSSSDITEAMDDDTSFEYIQMISKLSPKQKDQIISNFVCIGDRVIISVPQKPPRYGKKITPKPINYTGIVKYKGTMDKPGFDPRLYIGVRLDNQAGDTDGLYKGKRYMYTPLDQGKFFKIRDINFLLDVKTGRYIPVSRLYSRHFSNSQTNK